MRRKIHILLVATIICSFIFPGLVHAQDEKPVWVDNLNCNKDEQRFSGLQYCTGQPPHGYIHVIVIQVESPGLKIEYILPEGIDKNGISGECTDVNRSTKSLGGPGCDDPNNRNWYPVMSLEWAVNKALKQPNMAVVINGDYSACTISPAACVDNNGNSTYRVHGPEGYTVVRGDRLDGPMNYDGDNNIVRRPFLVISETSPLRVEIHQANSDDGSIQYNWAYTGMGGAPWLIQNGEISTRSIASCENAAGSCYDGASQTAVGLTLDKKWMFLVVAVKAEKLENVATFMKDQLDVWQAIKFDGGGSSQLYYSGSERAFVEMGDERPLTNFLAIYAQPGTGIFPENPQDPSETSEPPTIPDLNWLQNIQKKWTDFWISVDTWWNGVKTWWQELPQRVEDWLIQQFMDWLVQQLNQLCGSAGLVPATKAVVIYSCRRRKLRYH